MRKSRIRNAYTKSVGKEWYKKMLAAKQAKADKAKREKMDLAHEMPKLRPELPATPKKEMNRIEVTDPTPASPMELNHSTHTALEKALQRLEQQARGM